MKLFFDINKKTMPQQVKKNKEDIEAQHEIDVEIDEKIDKEIQDRTDADIGLQALIQAIQEQLDALGNVLTFKGSVATTADLPATNNHVGDVYFVVSDQAGYVWIDDDGTERWELLGLNIDLSAYATKSELETGLAGKQDTLTAGTNISIIDGVISATGGDSSIKNVVYDNLLTSEIHITNQEGGIFKIGSSLNTNTKIYYNGSGTEYFELPTNTLTSSSNLYYLFITKQQIGLTMTWMWYIIYTDDSGDMKFISGQTTSASGNYKIREIQQVFATCIHYVTIFNTADSGSFEFMIVNHVSSPFDYQTLVDYLVINNFNINDGYEKGINCSGYWKSGTQIIMPAKIGADTTNIYPVMKGFNFATETYQGYSLSSANCIVQDKVIQI